MKIDTLLAILQQSEYHWDYFSDWLKAHDQDLPQISPKKWTLKLKILKALSTILFFFPLKIRLQIALLVFNIFEFPIRSVVISLAKAKLRSLQRKGLVVVAIAGSYAKTSTKHTLSHLLKKQVSLIVTPKSVNTFLGISQIVLKKLSNEHKVFLVELGEYYPGDIRKLTKFIHPNLGILTPVGTQHLERMGSFEKIVSTMSELLDYFKNKKERIIVADLNSKHYGNLWNYYGSSKKSQYKISKVEVSQRGTDFSVNTPDQELSAFSPLFGTHQVENLLPALWLADKLKLDVKKVLKAAATLPYVSRRHEPIFGENNILILDNSYNTNPDSIKVSLDLINQLKSSKKIIITMGFLELGDETDKQHFELGKLLAHKVDYVGLIKSRWNDQVKVGFLKAGGSETNFIITTTPNEALDQLHDKITPNSIVLLEGGYQEIFT